jgi:hypothetical protein
MILTGETEVMGEKHVAVLLCPPQIKQDRPIIEQNIRGEGRMHNGLSHGTASYKKQF